MLYPVTSEDVLAIQERLTKAAVPVPITVERVGESVASLANESVAEGFPLTCGVKATLSDTPLPTGTVNGKGVSRTANCELLLETEEMVTLPPLALSSTVRFSVVPTATSPKLSVAGVIASAGLEVPMPVNGMLRVGPTTRELPAAGPTACGLKIKSNFTCCPGAKINGNVTPLTEKSLPSVFKPARVTFHGSVLVNTAGSFELVPTGTSPNATPRGLTVTPSRVTPIPAKPTVMTPLGMLLTKVIVPPTRPFAVGAKVTLTPRLSPGARTCGSVPCETLKLLLVALTSETVTFDRAWLVATTTRVSVWPTTTLAKCR